jgi:hypothetical protein
MNPQMPAETPKIPEGEKNYAPTSMEAKNSRCYHQARGMENQAQHLPLIPVLSHKTCMNHQYPSALYGPNNKS